MIEPEQWVIGELHEKKKKEISMILRVEAVASQKYIIVGSPTYPRTLSADTQRNPN